MTCDSQTLSLKDDHCIQINTVLRPVCTSAVASYRQKREEIWVSACWRFASNSQCDTDNQGVGWVELPLTH